MELLSVEMKTVESVGQIKEVRMAGDGGLKKEGERERETRERRRESK